MGNKTFDFSSKKRIFCPKTTKFGPKLEFFVNLGQAMQASLVPVSGSVGGCGARAVSRKTPIYFMVIDQKAAKDIFTFHHFVTKRQVLAKMLLIF